MDRRARLPTRGVGRAFAVVGGLSLSACSLLFDTGGLDEGEAARDAAPDDPAAARACPSEGRTCVPAAPAGWVGPLAFYDGPQGAVPDCPPTMPDRHVDGHRGFAPPAPHTCEACECEGTGAVCSATVESFSSGDCTTNPSTMPVQTQMCVTPFASAFRATATVTGGVCVAKGGKPVLPPVPWDSAARACGAPSYVRTGCGEGSVCAPVPPGPFRTRHCVTRLGESACPAGPYSERSVVYTDVDDRRTCSACTCSDPETTCAGAVTAFASQACVAFPQTLSLPFSTCGGPQEFLSFRLTSLTPSTACAATGGGEPSGEITPAKPTTICCAP